MVRVIIANLKIGENLVACENRKGTLDIVYLKFLNNCVPLLLPVSCSLTQNRIRTGSVGHLADMINSKMQLHSLM